MAVIHIEKANPEINGLYQFINQQFLIEEFADVEWVNRRTIWAWRGFRRLKLLIIRPTMRENILLSSCWTERKATLG